METVRHLIAWCELRQDFRSFRTDRVIAAGFLDERYPERPSALRAKWRRSLAASERQTPRTLEAEPLGLPCAYETSGRESGAGGPGRPGHIDDGAL
jgi:predicted DNA-binding transcriptional regulator YafY